MLPLAPNRPNGPEPSLPAGKGNVLPYVVAGWSRQRGSLAHVRVYAYYCIFGCSMQQWRLAGGQTGMDGVARGTHVYICALLALSCKCLLFILQLIVDKILFMEMENLGWVGLILETRVQPQVLYTEPWVTEYVLCE